MQDDVSTNPRPRPPLRQTLPKSARICARADFDRTFKSKRRASDANLTVYMAANSGAVARLGISASRRLGGAVVRNRIKRLVREAFRRLRNDLPPGTDWVVIPRRGNAGLAELSASLDQLVRELLNPSERDAR